MKIVSKEQQDAQQRATVIGGLKGMAGGFAVSIPASLYLQRTNAYYRRLQPSLKAFGVIMVVVPAFVISAEHAGQKYEQEQWHDAGKAELDAQQRRQEARWESLTPGQKISDFVRRHEYGVIVGSWAVAMAGALRYVMKDPLQSTTQKVVQARVWAQALTIGIIIAAGILTHSQRSKELESMDEHNVRHLPPDHSWLDVLQEQEKEKEREDAGSTNTRGAL
ncbi:hypothetical protein BD309DRAFT_947504 [Dichomitus squalens]|uniref:Uncharacterized protein n=1 Tax=Dichomitus squalens TaxID=114155 RepID=A0A4Q9P4K1_9APHY|nr:hypothetical protein BD309DRAFT_947504 [Dichomitus squalens]TBU64052.1 hypothetical protein BD310DRAFT_1035228 [Dichomitus squalens]